jgi:Enolase C-terminal domain-like
LIGEQAGLFVDANGAYSHEQALQLAGTFAEQAGVTWFEEPVSSDDIEGLRLLRDRCPAGMSTAADEDGCDLFYFRRMLDAGTVDVLQADVTRCGGGVTRMLQGRRPVRRPRGFGFRGTRARRSMRTCVRRDRPARACEVFPRSRGIEELLFDGAPPLRDGALCPNRATPDIGLVLQEDQVERYERC